jgi:glycosyltransferase involved in cell wall biosynthesis
MNEDHTAAQHRQLSNAKVSIVVPCYCESEVLPQLFQRVTTAATLWNCDFEVIAVDDGSKDNTWDLLAHYHEIDARWKPVRLSRNFGHQVAVWTGLMYASGDVIAVLDADLQDDPEILPRFFEKWEEGFDVVYGVRRNRKEGIAKRTAYQLYYRIMAFMADIDVPLDSGDFCVMNRIVVNAMLQTREMEPYVRGIRAWAGFRQYGLEYDRSARAAGEVKYTLRKLMGLAVNGIFSFSTRPLRIATFLGFGVSAVAFLGVIFTLIQRLFATRFEAIGWGPAPGFATIVISIVFLGGVQLICLGILGEYIGRIFENVKGRPQTVVREWLSGSNSSSKVTRESRCHWCGR